LPSLGDLASKSAHQEFDKEPSLCTFSEATCPEFSSLFSMV